METLGQLPHTVVAKKNVVKATISIPAVCTHSIISRPESLAATCAQTSDKSATSRR
eukprot:m.133633 g.133633  ORF g.133633 m.133633 type:complete len:56 (-) comp9506_c0_seq6:2122-2289(-)